jgi:hypothetical protein
MARRGAPNEEQRLVTSAKMRDSRAPLAALAWLVACLGLVGCGQTELDLDEKLVVAMYGVFEAPADAAGNAEPKYQTYTFTGLSLTGADGAVVDLFADADTEPTEVRIIDRSQIIFETSVHDYVDDKFTAASVGFDAAVGVGGAGDELTTALPQPTLTLSEAFAVEKAKSRRLVVKVQWKNTITRDADDPTLESVAPPTFAMEWATE